MTGQLDSNTLEVMSRPWCGFTDLTRYGYFDGQPKWNKTVVTYRIINYTPDMSQSDVDAAKAFKLYSDVFPLDFNQTDSETADIVIMFRPGDHGDFATFDGENGVLAHVFSPGEGNGGDTHFDEDENWTLTSAGMREPSDCLPNHNLSQSLSLHQNLLQRDIFGERATPGRASLCIKFSHSGLESGKSMQLMRMTNRILSFSLKGIITGSLEVKLSCLVILNHSVTSVSLHQSLRATTTGGAEWTLAIQNSFQDSSLELVTEWMLLLRSKISAWLQVIHTFLLAQDKLSTTTNEEEHFTLC
ncbi:hypothetical protein CHARACLAT_030828 [Characodon lateralis]|uniref:Peptidase metallopeptidase domain-containing protein n=1 Tax=Characodon lateralis TaxID=208331 RepID=A0ABU7CUZ5_9TELE|nr:hypothetical protein [Characodon lateralis]